MEQVRTDSALKGKNGSDHEIRFGGSTRNRGPLALADGKLLIRDHTRLLCVKVGK